MKKYISGLLTGIIIATSLTAFAALQLKVIPNPYPIFVNGTKANVQGYNINGSTCLKLSDFKIAGIDAQFNKDKKQIEVKSLTSLDNSKEDGKFTLDGVRLNVEIYGKGYVGLVDISKKYLDKKIHFNYITIEGGSKELQMLSDEKVILDNIPYKMFNNSYGFVAVEYDYYITNMMPLLQ